MSFKHMLKANKNELLSLALAGFLIMNSGFTAPQEVIEEAPAKAVEPAPAPVMNNAPTAISVSENGSIALASDQQKAQFALVEPEEESAPIVEPAAEPTAEVIDDVEMTDAVVEEAAPVENVEYVDDYVEEPQYAAVMAMEATAYLPTDGSGEGITAMGIPATYGVAAVDPSVIPLGSRLYVPGYGEAIAADTGGAISGYRIDLCMESYEQAMAFGRRVITVFLID